MRKYLMVRKVRKRNKKTKFINKIKNLLFISFFVFITLFIFLEIQVRPMVDDISKIKAQAVATEAINQAIENKMNENEYDYFDFVNVSYSGDEYVNSITTNTVNMNMIKSEYSLEMQKAIDEIQSQNVGINFGELIGIELLNGLGPEIPLNLSFISSIETEVKSSFVSTGINQTLHIIELVVKAEIYLTSDEYVPNVVVNTNVPLAQSVVVGETPDLIGRDYLY